MLTYEQLKIFTDCARQISSATGSKYWELRGTARKLDAYNMLLEPPATIRKANDDQKNRLEEQTNLLRKLREKADKACDYVNARPSICSYISELYGKEYAYVFAGMLPDFERAPEDEKEALQAVTEYHEAKSA